MKTKISKFCFALLIIFASQVSASVIQEVPAFTSLDKDDVWQKFIRIARESKSIVSCNGADGKVGECFMGQFVGDKAADYALTQELLRKLVPEELRNKTRYSEGFMAYNGFSGSDLLPIEILRQIATGKIDKKGLFYLQDPEYLKSIQAESINVASSPVVIKDDSGSESLTKIVAPKVDPVPDELDPINVRLQASQAEIRALQANLKKLSVGNANVAQLKGKISEIETQLTRIVSNLNGLSDGQENLSANQSKIAKSMQSELDAIQATVVKINTMKADMEAKFLEKDSEVSELWEGLNKINDYYFIAFTSAGVILAIIVLYLGWERRRVSKVVSTLKNVEIDVEGIKVKLTNLEFDQQAVSNTVLKSMNEGEEKALIVRNISTGVNYVVGITRESEFIFSISGINRRPHDSGVQKIDIRKTILRNMIINAGEPLRFCKVSPEAVATEVKAAA